MWPEANASVRKWHPKAVIAMVSAGIGRVTAVLRGRAMCWPTASSARRWKVSKVAQFRGAKCVRFRRASSR